MSSDLTITDAKPVPVSGALPLQHQPPLELDQGPLPDPGHKGPHEMATERPRRHAAENRLRLVSVSSARRWNGATSRENTSES